MCAESLTAFCLIDVILEVSGSLLPQMDPTRSPLLVDPDHVAGTAAVPLSHYFFSLSESWFLPPTSPSILHLPEGLFPAELPGVVRVVRKT